MKAMIEMDQCMGCANCLPHCPQGILQLSQTRNVRGVYPIEMKDASRCVGCGVCEQMCTTAAIHVPGIKHSGYALIDREHTVPHAGCYLGSLTKALADAIAAMGIQQEAVLFKKKASDVNLHIKTYTFEDDAYFTEALRYQQAHPRHIVIAICPSSKPLSTMRNEERLRRLRDTAITIVHTSDWFETDSFDEEPKRGGTHVLEELAKQEGAYFAARAAANTPLQLRQLQSYLEKAFSYQREGKGCNIVELVFPCFYRLSNRPSQLMEASAITRVRRWFTQLVLPAYPQGILIDKGAQTKEG